MRWRNTINHEALVTARQFGMFVGIDPTLVAKWAYRYRDPSHELHFTAKGKDGREHLYRLGDLLRVEAACADKVDATGGPQRRDLTAA